MERRETYDPEDIESLLSERAFDELLEEERAFVLRHLNGREEYEAMRALLLQVRRDERPEALLEVDDAVRERVLMAYRNERRPKWGFSLNSVLAAFWPAEATGFWRPALALGALALVVVLAVGLWQRLSTHTPQLAELHEPQRPAPGEAATPDTSIEPVGNGAVAATVSGEMSMTTSQEQESFTVLSPPVMEPATDLVAAAPTEQRLMAADSVSVTYLSSSRADHAVAVTTMEAESDMALKEEKTVARTVDSQEMARNMSVTNATGEVAKKVAGISKQRSADRERYRPAVSLADTPQLTAALAAAW